MLMAAFAVYLSRSERPTPVDEGLDGIALQATAIQRNELISQLVRSLCRCRLLLVHQNPLSLIRLDNQQKKGGGRR